jgi:hypothetical protein
LNPMERAALSKGELYNFLNLRLIVSRPRSASSSSITTLNRAINCRFSDCLSPCCRTWRLEMPLVCFSPASADLFFLLASWSGLFKFLGAIFSSPAPPRRIGKMFQESGLLTGHLFKGLVASTKPFSCPTDLPVSMKIVSMHTMYARIRISIDVAALPHRPEKRWRIQLQTQTDSDSDHFY